MLSVREYLVFDPEGDAVAERLRAFRRVGGAFRETTGAARRGFRSRVTGLVFRVADGWLRLFEPDGRPVLAFADEGRALGQAEGRALGQAEGRALGQAEGRALGEAEGARRLLLRQLRSRFGTLPDDVVARVGQATPAALEAWAERLLDATRLGEVF